MANNEELKKKILECQKEWLEAKAKAEIVTEPYIVTGSIVPGQPIKFGKKLTDAVLREMDAARKQEQKAHARYREALMQYLNRDN